MRGYITAVLLLICIFTVGAQPTVREVPYYNEVEGYLAIPKDAKEAPMLILIHEWWGINDDIRAKAREFANDGYVTLAVDLYHGESAIKASIARALAGRVQKNRAEAFANLRAAADFLRALPETDSARLGSVGWCFGGGWSYEIAKNGLGASASVIYYGRFNPADDLSQMRAKIIGHFGENDRAIPVDSVREFQAHLKNNSGDHKIFIYPNAGHGFANPESRAHVAGATTQAYRRTLQFLREHL